MDFYLQANNSYNRLEEEFKKYGKLIFCVDFDDTIYDFHKKGRTYENVISLLQRWENYSEVIIFTGNGEANERAEAIKDKAEKYKYEMIEKYLNDNHIKHRGINCDASVTFSGRKVYANVYIDDRGGLIQVYNELLTLIEKIEKGVFEDCGTDAWCHVWHVKTKAENIALNPMDYVNNKIIAYKNPTRTYNDPYNLSAYTGMMFNGYI